ncbi:DUF3352 domain-containing protein [Candidatus Peregrinibacteria bacterium]|nr:DUF3352 domain-containing protein [Candidatus Peregrinibacteria bacterium]
MAKKKKKTVSSTKKKQTQKVDADKKTTSGKSKKGTKKSAAKPKTTTKKNTAKQKKVKVTAPKPEVKQPEQRKEVSDAKTQRATGLVLIIAGALLLAFVAYNLISQFLGPKDLSRVLPASNTIGYIEVLTNPNNIQVKQSVDNMQNYKVLIDEVLKSYENQYGIDFDDDIGSWMGRKAGLAILRTTGEEPKLEPILLAEVIDKEKAVNFVQKLALNLSEKEVETKEFGNAEIYSIHSDDTFQFAFQYGFMIAGKNKSVENYIISVEEDSKLLKHDDDFAKVNNNISQAGVMRGYLNIEKLLGALAEDDSFMATRGRQLSALEPFVGVYQSTGFNLVAEKGSFLAQEYTSLDKDKMDGNAFLTFDRKYRGKLLGFANNDPVFYFGGHNLANEYSRMKKVFSSSTKTPETFFQSLIDDQVNKYLGENISVEKDLLRLFRGEYLLTVENNFEEPIVTFILELENPSTDINAFEDLVAKFVDASGFFSPEIVTFELPDGTIGKEVVASPETIEKSTKVFNQKEINSLKIGDTGTFVYYSYIDNVVAVSNSEEAIRIAINRSDSNFKTGLTSTKKYENEIIPLIKNADQVFQLKPGALGTYIDLPLNPINSVTASKNYFDDGISTIYSIDVI